MDKNADIDMTFLSPGSLRLFGVSRSDADVIYGCGETLALGTRVPAGDICIKRFNELADVVLQVEHEGRECFVLVNEIDNELAGLVGWWKSQHCKGEVAARDGVMEKIKLRLRMYKRGRLRLASA